MKIYTGMLREQQGSYIVLSEEAIEYLRSNLHSDNVEGIKHVMRHLYVADYEHRGQIGREAIRSALLYALNCVEPARLDGLIEDPYDPIPRPPLEDMRQHFAMWWEVLFGDESYEAPEICSAEVPDSSVSLAEIIDLQTEMQVSPEVLNFPRTEGRPPGHGAPPPDKIARYEAPPLPRRPTDGARFFRWVDQDAAIKAAKKIHRRTGQWKVWVKFDWPIGEGYITGSLTPEYRRTVWACVRFWGGYAVDSFPDLRKGGPVDPEAP
jgi:hypothetical protein